MAATYTEIQIPAVRRIQNPELANLRSGSPEYRIIYNWLRRENRLQYRKPTPKILNRVYKNITGRCNNPRTNKYQYYGGRGIKNFLTLADLIFLWERDGGENMKWPSIDRKNSDGHYTLDNCRFIEFADNKASGSRPSRWGARCPKCSKLFKRDGRGRWFWQQFGLCPSCAQGMRRCKKCSAIFTAPNPGSRKTVCSKCRLVTRPCTYCGLPVTRDIAGRNSTGIIKTYYWFCSKRERYFWIKGRGGVRLAWG